MADSRNRPIAHAIAILGGAEKIVQHGLTAFWFVAPIEGLTVPDIGERFDVSAPVMAGLNLVYALAFLAALVGVWQHRRIAIAVLLGLAILDIVLEFTFHGPGFITVSVIVSLLLSGACLRLLMRERRSQF
ncbi:hypothetical protein [Cucumibacter marinus]|uniref:hypothetical protein n=1 Tax=Cucumibacter marinus TaxID=1121252 RepID=UPI00040CCF61|nr:hypothetical protein [Cucumibacter marinus]